MRTALVLPGRIARPAPAVPGDDQRHLPARLVEVLDRRRDRPEEHLLVHLRHLPAHRDLPVPEHGEHVAKRRAQAPRALQGDQGEALFGPVREQAAAGCAGPRQEAEEDEPAPREPGHRDGGGDRRGARNGGDAHAGAGRRAHQLAARIANARGPGVAHQRHVPVPERRHQRRQAGRRAVLVVADEAGRDAAVREQAAGHAGVLGRDQADRREDGQGAGRDVLEVPYRGGDDVQGGHGGVVIFAHAGPAPPDGAGRADRDKEGGAQRHGGEGRAGSGKRGRGCGP